jgi:hypothetical protein
MEGAFFFKEEEQFEILQAGKQGKRRRYRPCHENLNF